MTKLENCLFVIKVKGEDTLVKAEGAYVSELNKLYIKLKLPTGVTMNYYVADLDDTDKFKINLN
jgi:hypothetical protein